MEKLYAYLPRELVTFLLVTVYEGNDIGRYGYQWWVGREEKLYFAMGYGGQCIAVLPEKIWLQQSLLS